MLDRECQACGKREVECVCYNETPTTGKPLWLNQPESPMNKQIGGNHYKDKTLQPWEIIDALELNFYEGNALKYLLRYKEKNGVEDLKKAIHYIEKMIGDMK